MAGDNVKERLIETASRLLWESKNPGAVTARQIAGGAGANLAMINYYFGSKDALIHLAVGKLMEDRARTLTKIRDGLAPARERLEKFVSEMADIVVDFAELTKPTIPYLLLEAEIAEPYLMLPLIRECCKDARSETECRMIAYQLTSFSQLIFYRSDDFLKYSGVDIRDKKQRDAVWHMMIDMLIPK